MLFNRSKWKKSFKIKCKNWKIRFLIPRNCCFPKHQRLYKKYYDFNAVYNSRKERVYKNKMAKNKIKNVCRSLHWHLSNGFVSNTSLHIILLFQCTWWRCSWLPSPERLGWQPSAISFTPTHVIMTHAIKSSSWSIKAVKSCCWSIIAL